MSITTHNIDAAIRVHAIACLEAGLDVHVWPHHRENDKRLYTHVLVTHPDHPGAVLLQRPSYPGFVPVSLSAPVTPSREYGSAVVVDHDDTPEGVAAKAWETVQRDTIQVRFTRTNPIVKIDRTDRQKRYTLQVELSDH